MNQNLDLLREQCGFNAFCPEQNELILNFITNFLIFITALEKKAGKL